MSIIVDESTKLAISGLTGREGSFHGLRNRDYGTDLVAGVTPGKGGQDVEGVPIFDTIAEAVSERGANTSMVFVPAASVKTFSPSGPPPRADTAPPDLRRRLSARQTFPSRQALPPLQRVARFFGS